MRSLHELLYVHYGSSKFDRAKFEPATNCGWIKPHGGLWASPVGEEFYGWHDWCEDERYRTEALDEKFLFKLSPEAKVLDIRTVEDLHKLEPFAMRLSEEVTHRCILALDFDKMLFYGYSAMSVWAGNDNGLYYALYGWDCDSLLVLDPEAVETL